MREQKFVTKSEEAFFKECKGSVRRAVGGEEVGVDR